MSEPLITLAQFEALVKDARRTPEEIESGHVSQTRERCENQVYEILEAKLGADSPLHKQFSEYCLHATLDECLDAALGYFKGEIELYGEREMSMERGLSIAPERRDEALRAYGKLHDGLSDMVESGRLSEADIPDDYQWLVETLTKLGNYWTRE